MLELAPGVLWLRIPLPFRLNHVNIYLIEDNGGWAVLDTGIANEQTKDIWNALAEGPLAGRKLTRLIVTHYHPDHIGLAGWLAERFGLPLITTQTTYLQCLTISLRPGALDNQVYRDFYLCNGLDAEIAALVATHGHGYLRMVAPLPPVFQRIVAGMCCGLAVAIFASSSATAMRQSKPCSIARKTAFSLRPIKSSNAFPPM